MSDRHYHDHAEDPALEALSDLYQQAPSPLPSAALDARILAMAGDETRVRRLPVRQLRRWSLPLSLAAVLVLAVALVPLLRQQLPATHRPMESPVPQRLRPAAAPPAAKTSAPEEATSRVRERRQEATTGGILAEPARGPSAPEAMTPEGYAAPPPAPAAMALENEAPVMQSAAESVPATTAELADDTGVMADMPAMAPTPSLSESAETRPEVDAMPPADQAPARTAVFSDPERWLTWIRLLYRQGREAEAEEELAAFQRQFPDYPLDSLEHVGEP